MCLRGNPKRLNQEETAATTLFSIILGRFNVICLTPQVDQITWKDAETTASSLPYVIRDERVNKPYLWQAFEMPIMRRMRHERSKSHRLLLVAERKSGDCSKLCWVYK